MWASDSIRNLLLLMALRISYNTVSLAQIFLDQNIQLSDEQEVVLSDIRREMLSLSPCDYYRAM